MAAAAGPVLTIGGKLISTLDVLSRVSVDAVGGFVSMGRTVGETAGYLKQVGVSAESLKFAFQNLKAGGALLGVELGIIIAGLIAIAKYLEEVGKAAQSTTEDLIAMSHSGDIFKQAAASTEIMVNGQNRLKDVLDAVHEKIKKSVDGYDDYKSSIDATAKASGYEINAQGDLIKVSYGLGGRLETLIEAHYRLSKAQYEAIPGTGQLGAAWEKLVEIGGKFITNVVPILTGELGKSSKAMRDQTDAANTSIAAIEHADDVNKRYASTLGVTVEGLKAQKNALADTYGMAITYTESERKQADVQKQLDDLNAKIAARGPVRVATIAAEATATNNLSVANTGLAAAQAAADDVMQRDNETRAQYAMRLKDAQENLKKLTEQSSAYVPASQAINAADQKTIIDQAKLAVAQEDLAKAQKKKGETDAEFILRVETLRGKISDYSAKLTEHTAVVGGATKAELEQKKALEEQIAALKQQDEVSKAKGAFDSLTKAFRDNIITTDQYRERAAALNAITGLYTQTALQQATAQEELMKSFSDPASEAWRSQLVINKDAIDGVVASTEKATEATDALNKKQAEAAKPTRAEAKVEGAELGGPKVDKSIAAAQAALDYANKAQAATESARQSAELLSASQEAASRNMKGNTDVIVGGYKAVDNAIADTKQRTAEMTDASIKAAQARSAADEKASKEMKGNATVVANAYKAIPKTAAAPPVIAPKVDTAGAVKDIQAFTTDKIGAIPKEKTTTIKADTVTATTNTNNILKLFGTIPKVTNTEVNVDGKLALQTLDDIYIAHDRIKDKTVTVTVNYVTHGSPPEGYQHGGAFTVPPNPRGGMGDYFPVLAAPGERVTIQTPAQQHGTAGGVGASQDTYNYTTNIYNPLAAAMWADQQRRERIAHSNARMGVA